MEENIKKRSARLGKILSFRKEILPNEIRFAMRYYATGAREQHRIDIEKACEWLKNFEGGYIQEYQIKQFIKALEE